MAKFLLLVFILSFLKEKACSVAGAQRNGVLLQEPVVQPSALGKTLGSSDAANGAKAEESVSQSALNGSGGPQETPAEEGEDFPTFLQNQTAEDVTADCIIAHNEKRVGKLSNPLQPVKRDDRAANQALTYMQKVVAEGCPFKHSHAAGFGENLYATGGKSATCDGAVGAWYSEIEVFKGQYPGKNWPIAAGHFLQLMWANSTGLGCARTLGCSGNKQILVCNYTPAGNYVGSAPFSEEVWNSIMQDLKGSPASSSNSGSSPIGPSTNHISTSYTFVFIAILTTVTSLSASLA